MKKKQKKNLKINENSSINIINFDNIDTKRLEKKESRSNLFYVLIIFISLIILCYFLYLLKKQLNLNFGINHKVQNDPNYDRIIKPYIVAQNDFCENPNKYLNQKYEDEITLFDVKFDNLKYQMYVFKSANVIIHDLNRTGVYERDMSTNITKVLKLYGTKKNIKENKDILVLDIGLNVGWYPSLLGRYGYTIIGFEAFERNYYVAKKNNCHLNKDKNVVIVTKGLGAKEKKCLYFNQVQNAGNGMVICEDNKKRLWNGGLGRIFFKDSEVEVTTLDSFMPYLSNKNIALMKIDVEGHELEVLNGGKELITKYHVPFIVIEFSPNYLREVGTRPRDLPQFLVDNGYKITLDGFFSKNFISVNELIRKIRSQDDCYFIHESMIY